MKCRRIKITTEINKKNLQIFIYFKNLNKIRETTYSKGNFNKLFFSSSVSHQYFFQFIQFFLLIRI